MYAYIKGKHVKSEGDYVIIENGGIGYKIYTSATTMADISHEGEAKVFTELIVRENDMFLVGFASQAELFMYKQLTSVSGVGTKAALAILSVADYSAIAIAIVSGDVKLLERASGVGKKTAERIVVDLKDKIEKLQKTDVKSGGISRRAEPRPSDTKIELYEALQVLGYSKREIDDAYRSLGDNDLPVEMLILECLRLLS